MNDPLRTSELDYELPPELIAQSAVEPRDAARLLVVDGLRTMRFADLTQLLEPGDLLVVNQTRVRAARLHGRKTDTGGAVELLLLRRSGDEWEALIKPARRIRQGTAFDFGSIQGVVTSPPTEGVVTVMLSSHEPGDVDDLLPHLGTVPLPPYFHGQLDDPERYQTIFAKTVGSAAAPTASLHFTPDLVHSLAASGVAVTEIDLEVGLDTFRPIAADMVEEHVIHTERYWVPPATAEAISSTHDSGRRVIAVGTTVVRTLESAADGGEVLPGHGVSDLFIQPGYEFRVVDAMITNFHAPRTTLVALVAAAMGPAWRTVYEHAVDQGYRFLSFGDAMFISGFRR